jgi:2-dehydro-3-deoxyphosphogluconate aldolase/(4S)-4-hydroxy-2-oxoglutarate aldolase
MRKKMRSIFTADLIKKVEKSGIIAVIVIDDPAKAVPLAKVLVDEGITAMELTLRTPGALEALGNVTKKVPQMLAGVGTVLQPEQLDQIIKEKAQFAVAPGLNPRVLQGAIDRKFPFAPGITTASELEQALEFDCPVVKLFPAENMGGVKYLKSLNGPYGFLGIRYIPLGGLNAANMASYLERPEVLALGGSWIAPKTLIDAEDWSAIAANAREAVKIVKEVRG